VIEIPKGAGDRRGGKPRSDLERIQRHFDISEKEAKERFDELKEKLPPRGTGV
jgi:hypothetical protein